MNLNDMPSPAPEPAKAVTPEAAVVPGKPVEEAKPENPGKGIEAPVAQKEDKPAEPKKFKLNIKGKEVELTEEQVIELSQKSAYADQQIKEAAQLKKGVAALLARIKENPWEVLEDPAIGHKAKELAVAKIREIMADEEKDPKDRELELTRKQLEAYKKTEADAKAKADQDKKAAETQALATRLRGEIIGAMDAMPQLPKTQANMDRVIQYMRSAYRKTGKVLPAAEAANLVYTDWKAEVNTLAGLDVDKLKDMFGDDVLAKLEQIKLARLKDRDAAKFKPAEKKESEVKKTKSGRVSEKEFEKNWKNMMAGL